MLVTEYTLIKKKTVSQGVLAKRAPFLSPKTDILGAFHLQLSVWLEIHLLTIKCLVRYLAGSQEQSASRLLQQYSNPVTEEFKACLTGSVPVNPSGLLAVCTSFSTSQDTCLIIQSGTAPFINDRASLWKFLNLPTLSETSKSI